MITILLLKIINGMFNACTITLLAKLHSHQHLWYPQLVEMACFSLEQIGLAKKKEDFLLCQIIIDSAQTNDISHSFIVPLEQ